MRRAVARDWSEEQPFRSIGVGETTSQFRVYLQILLMMN